MRSMTFLEAGSAIMRFPAPGYSVFPDEKLQREISVMRFIEEKTLIRVPHVLYHGTVEESPAGSIAPNQRTNNRSTSPASTNTRTPDPSSAPAPAQSKSQPATDELVFVCPGCVIIFSDILNSSGPPCPHLSACMRCTVCGSLEKEGYLTSATAKELVRNQFTKTYKRFFSYTEQPEQWLKRAGPETVHIIERKFYDLFKQDAVERYSHMARCRANKKLGCYRWRMRGDRMFRGINLRNVYRLFLEDLARKGRLKGGVVAVERDRRVVGMGMGMEEGKGVVGL
ncbi:hypothetical protein BO70DRAFT_399052 [Aspergillus heteromorphus CBS 117.55]|uniref:Uncharacterized protein n=1 Tax=Aspergillus heteromorphus CBS 117.55 TaxID=1448321 RepID=A0A317VHP8_9EURO|nr:uncharacterized protein BO70DRAFT_399052 [Aspergillus heteromorphus CBS 117.55]PWY72979.1 hypothetical protein BO70DRAFT_399052 [Aspergillus heteromorphus CBS 117.55]